MAYNLPIAHLGYWFKQYVMPVIITTQELSLLRMTAEGVEVEEMERAEKISKKEIDARLKTVYKKLKTRNPLEALQVLAQTEFKVVDLEP